MHLPNVKAKKQRQHFQALSLFKKMKRKRSEERIYGTRVLRSKCPQDFTLHVIFVIFLILAGSGEFNRLMTKWTNPVF